MDLSFSDLNLDQKTAFLRVFINTLQHKKAESYRVMVSEALSQDLVRAVVNFRLQIDDPELIPLPNSGELWILEEISMPACYCDDPVEFKCVCPVMSRIELRLKSETYQFLCAGPVCLTEFAKEQDLKEEFEDACRFSLCELANERVLVELHEDLCVDWNEDLEAL